MTYSRNQGTDVDDWEDFLVRVKELRSTLDEDGNPPVVLFRGQGNSDLQLTTTLDRSGNEGMSFNDYYRLITRIGPAIETVTRVNWDVHYSSEVRKSFQNYDTFNHFPSGPVYSYMAYLRHHGFPSPLLDWSHSPYVAAFFAFRRPVKINGTTDKTRALYVFCENPTRWKDWSSDRPRIRRIGPYVRTHRRHFFQQADYTICGNFQQVYGDVPEWCYARHEDVFAHGRSDQDVLWKFNIPSTERANILKLLDEYNLNAFSLFDTEDSLMETLAFRELGTSRSPLHPL